MTVERWAAVNGAVHCGFLRLKLNNNTARHSAASQSCVKSAPEGFRLSIGMVAANEAVASLKRVVYDVDESNLMEAFLPSKIDV